MAAPSDMPWEGRYVAITHEFAQRCAELRDGNPYPDTVALDAIMLFLATELWDFRFSRSEIESAFRVAIERLPKYCAGQERRA
jgi:hypothetical protein